MKNYAKVGKRAGKPAYCTPWSFRMKHFNKVARGKAGKFLLGALKIRPL